MQAAKQLGVSHRSVERGAFKGTEACLALESFALLRNEKKEIVGGACVAGFPVLSLTGRQRMEWRVRFRYSNLKETGPLCKKKNHVVQQQLRRFVISFAIDRLHFGKAKNKIKRQKKGELTGWKFTLLISR